MLIESRFAQLFILGPTLYSGPDCSFFHPWPGMHRLQLTFVPGGLSGQKKVPDEYEKNEVEAKKPWGLISPDEGGVK